MSHYCSHFSWFSFGYCLSLSLSFPLPFSPPSFSTLSLVVLVSCFVLLFCFILLAVHYRVIIIITRHCCNFCALFLYLTVCNNNNNNNIFNHNNVKCVDWTCKHILYEVFTYFVALYFHCTSINIKQKHKCRLACINTSLCLCLFGCVCVCVTCICN